MTTPIQTIPIIKATDFVGKQGSGGSHPLLLRLEDGRVAHVKFQQNPQTTRSLINDLIGTILGRYLDAPAAEAVLVEVNTQLRARIPYLTKYRWLPGLQFGTIFLDNAIPIRKLKEYRDIANWSELPLCMLLETWLYNQDVKLSHVLCIPEHNQVRMIMVDHGFIFPSGPSWSVHDLKKHRRDFPSPAPLTWLASKSPSRFYFDDAVNRINSLSQNDLSELINLVPADWGLSSRRMRAIVDFLMFRQNKLTKVAQNLETLWNRNKKREDDVSLFDSAHSIKTSDPSPSIEPTSLANSPVVEEFPNLEGAPKPENLSLRFKTEGRKSPGSGPSSGDRP